MIRIRKYVWVNANVEVLHLGLGMIFNCFPLRASFISDIVVSH